MNEIKGANRQTKNEHYVPQCYLKRWVNEKNQVYVYDKVRGKSWPTNINNVACERYFYDVDYRSIDKESLKFLLDCGINPDKDDQFIEHLFSAQIETIYSNLLKKIADREEITPWYEQNCFFMSRNEKAEFSICLAYQMLRTKATRSVIKDLSNLVEQWLNKMNVDEAVKEKSILKAGEEDIVHANMILNPEHVLDMANTFYGLTWVLLINRTNLSLYTSDTPISTCAHLSSPFMSMSGIGSEGVEVIFPVSPNYVLVMYDANYHIQWRGCDRHFFSVCNEADIERYNNIITVNSGQYVFSINGAFDLIEALIEEDHTLLKRAKVQLVNGKDTYEPEDIMDLK